MPVDGETRNMGIESDTTATKAIRPRKLARTTSDLNLDSSVEVRIAESEAVLTLVTDDVGQSGAT